MISFYIDPADLAFTKLNQRGNVSVPCRCSLNNLVNAKAKNSTYAPGYCGSVIGTTHYSDAASQMLNILSSSSCHTLDRANMRAQKGTCGIGTSDDSYRLAIESWFNVTYWPYTQSTYTYNCISLFFADSYWNLILKTAHVGAVATVFTLAALSATFIL